MTALTPSKPGAGPAAPAHAGGAPAAAPAPRRRIIPLVVAALVLGGGGTYYAHARHFEDTDDAQIDGNITNLSPRVAGTLVAVNVQDNQVVKVGDVLAEIDPIDYEIAVAQAKAVLAQAEASFNAENPSVPMTETSNETALSAADADVSSAESGLLAADREVKQLTAQLELAKANAKNAMTERERADKLGAQGAISQAELDNRNTSADAATANVAAMTAALAAAQARYTQAQSRIGFTRAHVAELKANAPRQLDVRKASVGAREAALDLARAQLHQAELNLGYTKIVAPVAGIIGRKSMSVGDRVAPGQQVLAIARTDGLWVTANFRETQLRDMRPGMPATIHVDALEPRAARQGRERRRRHGLPLQPLPAGERVRQLREGGAAHPRAHRPRPEPAQHGPPPPRNVGRARGARAMTAAAAEAAALVDEAAPRSGAPASAGPPSYFETGWTGGRNRWAIALVVTLATFMEVLDSSIANVSLPAHRRRPLRQPGREHVGAHLVPRRQRHRAPHQRVAREQVRPQALLHDLRGALHAQLVPVRDGALAPVAASPSASCRASGAAGSGPSEQAILADTFPPRSAARPSPCTAWPSCSPPPSAPRSAASSPTTTRGAGSSSSTSRSASSRSPSASAW